MSIWKVLYAHDSICGHLILVISIITFLLPVSSSYMPLLAPPTLGTGCFQ